MKRVTAARDALPLEGWRHAGLVDVKLACLARAMVDRGGPEKTASAAASQGRHRRDEAF